METNKQLLMSYNSFKTKVCEHLAKYNFGDPGTFKNYEKTYPYIVEIKGKKKEEIVLEIIKRDGVEKTDMFCKPHQYAHHLNSSQVVCYEFFRPLIDNKGDMIEVIDTMGIPSNAFIDFIAEFEKEFDDGEGTNFDFYLSANKTNNLHVEVKYTEQGFGKCDDDERHRLKFENIYKPLIYNSFCIKEDMKKEIRFEQMQKCYQLFRNILRIKNDSDYVVFLFPHENSIAKGQFESFRDTYLSSKGKQNVKGIFWENLTGLMSKHFREKFFFYV